MMVATNHPAPPTPSPLPNLCMAGSHRVGWVPTARSKMARTGRRSLGGGGAWEEAESPSCNHTPMRLCLSPLRGGFRALLGPYPATVLLGPISQGSSPSRNRIEGEWVESQLCLGRCTPDWLSECLVLGHLRGHPEQGFCHQGRSGRGCEGHSRTLGH